MVKRTETIYLNYDKNLSWLCHISKNLYNQANFIVKQSLNDEGGWVRYEELNKQLKGTENYSVLPTQTAQQTLKLMDKNWKSFFQSIKDWKKNPENYYSKPNPPKYKKKNGENILTFTNQQCKIKNGVLKLPKKTNLQVETRLADDTKLNQVRILPMGVGYKCEIVYEKDLETPDLNEENIASIDLGINNIVTMVNNIGEKPIVIKGGVAKSINQFYNKKSGKLKSIYDKLGIKNSKKLKKLYHKYKMKINDFFHKASKRIVDFCVKHNIGTLVIGYNEGWKQEVDMGKRNNQKFTQIPFHRLLEQLKYKAEDVGLKVIEQEESYTSKCSFLDGEPVERRTSYLGKRIKRGLFQSSNGTIINADVNGAYNIMKKAIPDLDGIEGVALHPVSIAHECN
ncbi:transposase, IS605 OrfB family (plasmid) [Methanohalobium evestigatum Z-7303]|uniref:Transposase, IS605 OrfB family n=1 Tax=Methanohalobium evestigatum (strain ATCC BAA-1072 / DSM 3721 / NBRC 107634 / OCM 161 / Z-7303) TaxID=644295 RepID=D7EBY9_METEZ|nr:RNA-guided endonuclease TnpB family protein [Methanohalobium evestigatum]ADI75111.1 transposase, IS605 OrfB family [Methanohalobium evestigatum Z-7303]